jgi:Rps23 Pro-64 3,4-dihydroxylase Tpa1-like proline 4-hydroxylase
LVRSSATKAWQIEGGLLSDEFAEKWHERNDPKVLQRFRLGDDKGLGDAVVRSVMCWTDGVQYLPGDHALPHSDEGASAENNNRQVAFVWHLAKDWRSEWGGALFWCPKACYLRPVFNTLLLFNVGPETTHSVTPVSPYAQGKRLAINGWWGTGRHGETGVARARPGRCRRCGNPDLLSQPTGSYRAGLQRAFFTYPAN